MKNWNQLFLISLFAILLGEFDLNAQQKSAFYYFDGDEVVFEFNALEYKKAIGALDKKDLAFEDLNINEVMVSQNPTEWSKKGWNMIEITKNVYQLRKKITSFGEGFDWKFKFLINSKYWTEVDEKYGLFTEPNDILEDVFGINENVNLIDEQGNAKFSLDGFEHAHDVILTGSFVNWDEHQIKMKKIDGGWVSQLSLPLGRYEYKFIIDGKWYHDPNNKHKQRNEHGTFNSVLNLYKNVTFNLNGYQAAEKVHIAGTFNDWSKKNHKMSLTENGWELILPLSSGKHFYKFVVDGEWIADPINPIFEADGEGNVNSVLFVQ